MQKVFLGAICIGFAPIFVKLLTLGPTAIGFYRCGLAAVILSSIFFFQGKRTIPFRPWQWPRLMWKLAASAGLLFALDLFVWHRSLIYCGAGMGTILANTQVFYVSLVGILFHKEKLTARFVGAVLLAFLGIYLLAGFQAQNQRGEHYWVGVALGLATGVFYAGYLLTMRRLEHVRNHIPTEQFLCLVSALAALFLFLTSVAESEMRLPHANEWMWLIGLALITQVLGWILITRNLSRIPVSRAGLVLITQPLVATVAGALIFKESLAPIQIVGAAVSLGSIYMGSSFPVPRLKKKSKGT
jgi:drug/metabolite transporter (DMT)-like permease